MRHERVQWQQWCYVAIWNFKSVKYWHTTTSEQINQNKQFKSIQSITHATNQCKTHANKEKQRKTASEHSLAHAFRYHLKCGQFLCFNILYMCMKKTNKYRQTNQKYILSTRQFNCKWFHSPQESVDISKWLGKHSHFDTTVIIYL